MWKLNTLKERLNKIDIDVEFVTNYPWVYLWKINGKIVNETFKANHGFTVGFLPANKDKSFHFTELNEIFRTIRKYCN